MKATRKATSFLAILCLILTLWAPAAVSAEAPVAAAPAMAPGKDLQYFGRSILEKMDNGQALCYAYDKLVDGLRDEQKEIDIAHRTHVINWDEAELVCDLVRADHPELYGVTSMGYTGSEDAVTTFYGYYDAEALSYKLVVEQRVEQLTAGLEKKSDYEKSLILHDRLCDAVVYEFSEHNQTVVGSLALGASVCAGYARGYQMLMQAVGIPCFYVVGYSRDQGHAWNLVKLDSEWYYTDVTWDDQNDNNADGSGIYYSYLNVTYEQISQDHTADEFAEYLPKTNATANNYYIKNGLVLDPDQPIDVKKLAKAFKENYPPQLYYTGEDPHEGAYLLFNNLQKIVKEMMGKKPYSNINASVGMLGNGLILYLVIEHPHAFETETIPAACTAKGTKTDRCIDCGYTVKEILPATGHGKTTLWQDETRHGYRCEICGMLDQSGEHTFEQDGITCDVCGYVSAVCQHLYEAVTVAPTCTEDGYVTETCTRCGDAKTPTILPATGHQECAAPGQDPTCMFPGYTPWTYCSACGVVLTESEMIPALPHDFSGMWQDEEFHGEMCIHCSHIDLLVHHEYDNDRDPDCNVCGWVREIAAPAPGDASGDGKINNKDLGLLQQMLNDWVVESDLSACDVNKDGKINNKDLGLLQQYLNGWDVELG